MLRKLLESKSEVLYVGTVGPRDLLYTPAAAITFHKVFSDSDILGIRAAFLGGMDRKLLPNILQDMKRQNIKADVLEAACAVMNEKLLVQEPKVEALSHEETSADSIAPPHAEEPPEGDSQQADADSFLKAAEAALRQLDEELEKDEVCL